MCGLGGWEKQPQKALQTGRLGDAQGVVANSNNITISRIRLTMMIIIIIIVTLIMNNQFNDII